MQVTFVRRRPGIGEGSASRFAPTEPLFAHAAIADPRSGHLRHDQRAARVGFSYSPPQLATSGPVGRGYLELTGYAGALKI